MVMYLSRAPGGRRHRPSSENLPGIEAHMRGGEVTGPQAGACVGTEHGGLKGRVRFTPAG